MFIVNQNRTAIWNLDNFENISLDGDSICISREMRTYLLGQYENDDRAEEVFKQILDEIFGVIPVELSVGMLPSVDLSNWIYTPAVTAGTGGGEPNAIAMPYSIWFMPEN